MAKRSILHMFDPMPQNSPFDVNMALDAGFDMLVPYNNVRLDSIHRLVQDAIFSRGPSGVRKTAIFIGGRDLNLAMNMLNTSKLAMVPPFEISVLTDPSGAFTTAAALVALVEKQLQEKHNLKLKGCNAVVFGGTGPVGVATGVIASLAGANTTIVDHLSVGAATDLADEFNRLCGSSLTGAVASSDQEKITLISDADIIFCTAKAGIQVISPDVLKTAKLLKVAGDVNAVPPPGIAGIKSKDHGEPLIHAAELTNAVGVGPLAVGNIKYKLQHALLKKLLEREADQDKPVYLDFREAFSFARTLV